MIKPLEKILFVSFLLAAPVALFVFPAGKNYIISLVEFIAESFLLIELILFTFRSSKQGYSWNVILILASVCFLFCSDTLNSIRMVKITDSYALLADCLYSGFAFFLLLFLVKKLNVFRQPVKEWFFIFLFSLMVDSFISYLFLLSVISPRKNGHLTKQPFAFHNVQGLGSQVQSEAALDCNTHQYTQTHGFLH